nr:Sel1-like repeat-containing protein [Mimivirus sp.]
MYTDPPNYKLAFKYYQEAANQNHTNAQYWLAIFYKTGKYVSKDNQKAIYWLTLAANQSLNSAKIKLAEMYMQGTCVEQDYHKAFELLNSSIYDDDTNDYYDYIAMSELARMYKYGYGVKEDISKAIYLYIQSKNLKRFSKYLKSILLHLLIQSISIMIMIILLILIN